jgi:hypothetical protein
MNCPKCGREVKSGKTICRFCGENIGGALGDGKTCPNCGTSVPAGERFCYNCFCLLDDTQPKSNSVPIKPAINQVSQPVVKPPDVQPSAVNDSPSNFEEEWQTADPNQDIIQNNTYQEEQPYPASDPYEKQAKEKGSFQKKLIIGVIVAVAAIVVIVIAVNVNNKSDSQQAFNGFQNTNSAAAALGQVGQDASAPATENGQPDAAIKQVVPEGIYTIYCSTGSKVLNLSAKTDEQSDHDGTNVMLWDPTNSNMQSFRIGYIEKNICSIYPLSSSNGYNRVVSIANSQPAALSAGLNIELRAPDIKMDQQWIVEPQGNNNYKIGSAFSRDLVMGAVSPVQNNANVELQTFTGKPEQLWVFVPVNKLTPLLAGKLSNGDTDPEAFISQLNKRNIAAAELNSFTKEQEGYIRNGIFALSGKIFQTPKYIQYFSSKPWYKQFSANDDDVKAVFNQFQLANLDICLQYEKDHGWR